MSQALRMQPSRRRSQFSRKRREGPPKPRKPGQDRGPEWTKVSREVMVRDNWTCVGCHRHLSQGYWYVNPVTGEQTWLDPLQSIGRHLEAHEVFGWSAHPEYRGDKSKMFSLCRDNDGGDTGCHDFYDPILCAQKAVRLDRLNRAPKALQPRDRSPQGRRRVRHMVWHGLTHLPLFWYGWVFCMIAVYGWVVKPIYAGYPRETMAQADLWFLWQALWSGLGGLALLAALIAFWRYAFVPFVGWAWCHSAVALWHRAFPPKPLDSGTADSR